MKMASFPVRLQATQAEVGSRRSEIGQIVQLPVQYHTSVQCASHSVQLGVGEKIQMAKRVMYSYLKSEKLSGTSISCSVSLGTEIVYVTHTFVNGYKFDNSFLLFFHFAVPPDPVVIFDENGTRRKVFVGPYQLGDTISLVCDAFGGESNTVKSVKFT